MELSLVLTNDSGSFQTILSNFIETSVSDTLADRQLAQAAASDADSSAAAAGSSATNAAASATTATTQAANALSSANAAGLSATSASGFAATAGTQAGNASTSASASAASASTAGVFATNSAGSATSASISAAAAAASAALIALPIPITSGGTGAITKAAARTALGVDYVQGKNRLVNGSCVIAQRGAITVTGSATLMGGPDRWSAQNGNGGGTLQQVQSTIIYQGITRPCVAQVAIAVATNFTGGNFWGGIRQVMEGYTVYDLLGQPITVSFIFQCTVAGTYSVCVRDSGNFSYITTFTAIGGATPQFVSVTIPALPLGMAIGANTAVGLYLQIGAQNNATYVTSTLNAWQAGTFMCATTQTFWGLTLNAVIAATDIQVEPGTTATPFERENPELTTFKCERYYQLVYTNYYGYNVAGNIIGGTVPMRVMRATPSLVAISAASPTNCAAPTVAVASVSALNIYSTVTATGPAYWVSGVYSLSADI